jgi:RNA recognition motif-containing protein
MQQNKLFVGGIPYETTENTLRDAFAKAGNVVSAAIIPDRTRQRPHAGYGFVEMASSDEAQAAIEMWNGQELDGRRLTVNVARPFEPRDNARRG